MATCVDPGLVPVERAHGWPGGGRSLDVVLAAVARTAEGRAEVPDGAADMHARVRERGERVVSVVAHECDAPGDPRRVVRVLSNVTTWYGFAASPGSSSRVRDRRRSRCPCGTPAPPAMVAAGIATLVAITPPPGSWRAGGSASGRAHRARRSRPSVRFDAVGVVMHGGLSVLVGLSTPTVVVRIRERERIGFPHRINRKAEMAPA